MKNLIKWILSVTVLTVAFMTATPAIKASAQDDYVSYQTFYDDLAPYGQWVYDPQYGYVWVPDVATDFRPYCTRGYWAATEYGNMWVSDYPWGWAAFHYGRWTYDPYYGWVWIPGSEWGPAWVSWRYGGGYYGWAPLGPGITISVAFGSYYCPDNWWVFVGPQYVYRHDFYHYWRGPRYNSGIIHNTTFIHNHYHNKYVYGPRPADIQKVTHQRINVYNVNQGHKPGSAQITGHAINVYRPEVRATTTNGRRAEPAQAVRAPRPVDTKMQAVEQDHKPGFRTAIQNRQVEPVRYNSNNNIDRVQPNPAIRQQNTNRETPMQQEPRKLERSTPMPRSNEQRFDSRPQQVQPQRQNIQQPVQQQPRYDTRPQQVQPQRNFDNRPQQVQPQRQNIQQPVQQQPRYNTRPQVQPQRAEPSRPVQQQRIENRPQPVQQQRFESRPVQQQPVQRAQPTIRQEPRRQATPAPQNQSIRRDGRR